MALLHRPLLSYQGPPSVKRNFRSYMDGMESEEASFSGQEDSSNREHILEWAKAYNELLAEEEAICLSVWTVACICGNLRLDHVLVMFAAALLEKQIVFVCSNLGLLSASVLSIIPLIRPYQWQSLLMPVLPDDMLDFLDAPVPYIVGVKSKTPEVQTKLGNSIVIDLDKNQVKCPTMPQLPQQKDLLSSLSSYHATLVGESFLAKRRPVYECTDIQAEAARGFLAILRSYLETLCSSLRAHTITNVQSHDDKVSLLLKESFIDSFPVCDQPFMKLFVDTQLFSVHTDLVLSFYQKD
ncbi:DENN domain-containing protein 5B [Nymphaea thermarum]|nr:DENN domain-containing protein 5B [Nymphaea thermarum]